MMRNALAALLVVAALAVAAGCGASIDKSINNATGTTTQTDTSKGGKSSGASTSSTATTDTTGSTDTTSSDNGSSAAGLSASCPKVANLSVQFSKALGAAGAAGKGTTDLATVAETYKAFAEKVPEAIRPAFKTLAAAYAQYAAALKGVDLSSGKMPNAAALAKMAKAEKNLDHEALSKAEAQIQAWAKENCNTGG
jgi:hypothetical protein